MSRIPNLSRVTCDRTLLLPRHSTRPFTKSSDYPSSIQDTMDETSPSPGPSSAEASPVQGPSSAATAGVKRKRASGGKFYAVKVGYQPGVYYNWNDCLAQVTGYKGAVCMSFPTYMEIYTDVRCNSIYSVIILSFLSRIISLLTK